MASQYRIFQKGISLIPKAATLDGPYNSIKGDLELLSSTNKLYFHNGTINDPVVQENVAATLANKTLTAPVINNATADTITGIAGGNLSLQSSSGFNVVVESVTFDSSTISASTDLNINSTGGSKTYFQATGTNIVRIDSDGIAFLNQKDARFYDADNSNYVGIDAPSTVPVDYTITLPSAGPTANTALVYDGTQYKWGAAGGADSAGANDDILATAFRARILDSFDDAPTASSSTINNSTTTATHVPNNQLYQIQYINTTITGADTTTPSISSVVGYTLQENDAVVLGSEVRFLNSSLGINTPFTLSSGSCVVSKTVSSKELYNSTFDGDSISDAFSASPFSEYLVDYQDSTTAIYETSIAPKVSYSVSQDGSTWSNFASRPQYQTEQIDSGSFASSGTNLYVRLFANFNTTGSGTINLLEYRAYMQKSPIVASGTVNQAYTRLAFPAVGQQKGCTLLDPAGYGGKSAIELNWDYSIGVNPTLAYGALDVYINGQIIPRFIDSTTTNGAYYTENSSRIIVLDSNYSATAYSIQIIQRQPMGNYTSSTGGSSSSTGSGLKNYLTTYNNNPGNGNFEIGDTSGWSLFNTTLTGVIPTGSINSGAASITTFNAITTTPLAGNYSLSVVGSSFTAGQGFITNAFTIDREDRAKVLAFNFSYEVVSGSSMNFSGTSSNTWAIYLHDGTSWIQPAGVYGMVQSSGSGYVTGTFQTGATATQYRLAVVCINGSVAGSLKFDDFFVGPQVSANAPAMSDWQSYTPAAAIPGFGTCTNLNFKSRRVGDSLEVFAYFTSGTPSGAVQIPLGFNGGVSNVTVDTSKVPPSSIVGKAAQSGFSATYFSLAVLAPATNQTFVNLGLQTSALSETTAITSNTINSSTLIELFFKVPIVGWSSNTVASADTDTRVVAASGYFNAVSLTSTEAQFAITSVSDSHAAFTSNSYVVPVSGYYQISAYYTGNTGSATANNSIIRCKVGGVLDKQSENYGTFSHTPVLSYVRFLNAGNILTFFGATDGGTNIPVTGTSSTSGVSIQRLSGPAVVQATETVAASYYINAATSPFAASPTVPINFNTVEFDSHNAVTTSLTAWKFTAPVSGTYDVATYVYGGNPGTSVTFFLYKNQPSVGTATKVITFQQSGSNSSGSCLIKLNAGDFIDMRPDSARSITGAALNGANCSYIQIKRIGN